MKYFLFAVGLCFVSVNSLAQIDNQNTSVRFESIDDNTPDDTPTGLELPDRDIPGLTDTQKNDEETPNLGDTEPEINFNTDDGLLDYKTNEAPKYFKKKDNIPQSQVSLQIGTVGNKLSSNYKVSVR